MGRNVEVKAPLGSREVIEGRLASLGARCVWTRRQVDTFFAVARGWLKLREAERQPAELIACERAEVEGTLTSTYHRQPCPDVEGWRALLGHVLEAQAVVRKERSLFLWEHTRIHLDRVEGLGDFVELETVVDGISEDEGRVESDHVRAAFALDARTFLRVPYRVLLAVTP